MTDEERKQAMSFLGAAQYKGEGSNYGWFIMPTPEERAREEVTRRQREVLRQRWLEPPSVIDAEWLSSMCAEERILGSLPDKEDLPWHIIEWIAEGRIKDAQGCCAEILKVGGEA